MTLYVTKMGEKRDNWYNFGTKSGQPKSDKAWKNSMAEDSYPNHQASLPSQGWSKLCQHMTSSSSWHDARGLRQKDILSRSVGSFAREQLPSVNFIYKQCNQIENLKNKYKNFLPRYETKISGPLIEMSLSRMTCLPGTATNLWPCLVSPLLLYSFLSASM